VDLVDDEGYSVASLDWLCVCDRGWVGWLVGWVGRAVCGEIEWCVGGLLVGLACVV